MDYEAIKEARKFLGEDYDHFSDEQMDGFLKRMNLLIKIIMEQVYRDEEEEK